MKKRIIAAVSALLLLIVGALIVLPRDNANPLPVDPLSTLWGGNRRTAMRQQNKSISIPGFDSLTFRAGTTSQSVNFCNPEVNGDRLFKFSLFVEDSEIWESGYCEAGHGYYDIEIDRALTAGEYPAALKVRCFKPDGEELNGAKINFTLFVEGNK